MNRHEKIADSALKRIADEYGLMQDCIYEFKSDIQVWLEDISNIVSSRGYILYRDNWPKFVFNLTDMQFELINSLEKSKKLDHIHVMAQVEADEENQPNAGIKGSTKYILDVDEFTIQGSFAVVKKMITVLFLGGSFKDI